MNSTELSRSVPLHEKEFDIGEFLTMHSDPDDRPSHVDELSSTSTDMHILPMSSTEDYLLGEFIDSPCNNPPIEQEQPSDLKGELSIIRQQMKVNEPILVNACRENPIWSLSNAINRSSFSAIKKIDVQFVDVDEVSEGAVDEGGPLRDLFRLSLKQLQESEIFLCKWQ